MTTSKQTDANRRNAQKSTGPKTPHGKQTARRNAVTHGLTAAAPVISPEARGPLDGLAQSIGEHYGAEGAMEKLLVDRIVDCSWRLQRVSNIEAGIFAAHVPKELSLEDGSKAPDNGNAVLGKTYARNAGAFSRLSRYERQLERSLDAAVHELERLQYARKLEFDPFYVGKLGKFSTAGMDSSRKDEEGSYGSATRQSCAAR